MSINKVYLDDEMLIDLSTDTVSSANDIAKGKIGHLKDGSVVTGTLEGGGGGGGQVIADVLEIRNSGTVNLDLSGETFTTLRNYSFYNNAALKTIKLPTTLTRIGSFSFRNCGQLASVNFDELTNLSTIGQYITQSTVITDITLPASVTSMETYTFSGSTSLKNLDMSLCTRLTSIPQYLANGCTKLETAILPDNATSIAGNVFQNDSVLTTVHLPNNITSIPTYCCGGCSALSTITLPPNITSIGTYAFQTSGLTSVTIPQTVTTISTSAFASCSKLTEVHFLGTPATIATNTFNNSKNLLDIYVPWSSGQVAGAPWGATNAQIYYNYVEQD